MEALTMWLKASVRLFLFESLSYKQTEQKPASYLFYFERGEGTLFYRMSLRTERATSGFTRI